MTRKKKNPYASRRKKPGDDRIAPKVSKQKRYQPIDTPMQIEDETIRDILHRSRDHYTKTRKYPDELKVLALSLRSAGYKIETIGHICGAAKSTVELWLRNPKFDAVNLAKVAQDIKDNLADRLVINANTAFNAAMDEEKVDKAGMRDCTTSGAIMLDKALLL